MSHVKAAVTFRHTAPTSALEQYAKQNLQRLGKYLSDSLGAHGILAVDSEGSQVAEIELNTHGTALYGKEQHEDPYAAIDLAVDKMKQQVRKQREKSKVGRRRKSA